MHPHNFQPAPTIIFKMTVTFGFPILEIFSKHAFQNKIRFLEQDFQNKIFKMHETHSVNKLSE